MSDKHYLSAGNAIPLSAGGLSAILDCGREVGLRAGFQF